MFNIIVLLVTGVWLVIQALLLTADGFLSSIYFKVIPFGLGVLCLYSGSKLMGWI